MNAKVKNLVRELRRTQGTLDCVQGKAPASASPLYRQAYAEQYAREQVPVMPIWSPF